LIVFPASCGSRQNAFQLSQSLPVSQLKAYFLSSADDESYAKNMTKHCRVMIATMIRMNEHLIKGGLKTFVQLIEASSVGI